MLRTLFSNSLGSKDMYPTAPSLNWRRQKGSMMVVGGTYDNSIEVFHIKIIMNWKWFKIIFSLVFVLLPNNADFLSGCYFCFYYSGQAPCFDSSLVHYHTSILPNFLMIFTYLSCNENESLEWVILVIFCAFVQPLT